MTSTDIHVRKITELLEELEDAIDRGIEERPITIGFMCSECSCQLLELYLHKLKKTPDAFSPVHGGVSRA